MDVDALFSRGSGQAVAPTATTAPPDPAKKPGPFWQEFLRVEFDKILLFALAIYLFHAGQNDLGKAAMYGLAVAINHNRFRWN